MTRLALSTPGPWFTAPSHSTPKFAFSAAAGRYVLLAFLPREAAGGSALRAALMQHAELFRDDRLCLFIVTPDPDVFAAGGDGRGLRYFLDADGAIARLYQATDAEGEVEPQYILLDPTLRLLGWWLPGEAERMFRQLKQLPSVDDHAGTPLYAPVLIVPRILELDLCRRLIGLYHEHGGAPSGIMVEREGKTVGVLNDFKKRRDAPIDDPELQGQLQARIRRRLLPEIKKAFQFEATRIERYIVARYAADDGGYFRAHRDDTTTGTAHRKFAVSINLNAEEFSGGDLRFPEFGRRTYRPPTGGAVVFSCSLLHEATPVTEGVRFAFLPFLYDEAGAAVRARNLHALMTDAPSPKAAGPATAGSPT